MLLCENQEGYRNLIKLVSTGYLDGFYYKPRIDKDLLSRHSKGLIALSACLRGDINETLLADRYDEARRLAYEYTDLFGKNNFFLELQDHGLDQDKHVMPAGPPPLARHRHSAGRHQRFALPAPGRRPRPRNPAVHPDRQDHVATRTACASTQPEFYLKTRDEMMALFGEVEDALDRTWDIAQRCQVKLEKVKEPFPKFDVPAEHTTDTLLRIRRAPGLREAPPAPGSAARRRARLKHDLAEYAERLDREIKHDPADEVLRLLPDRLGLHPLRQISAAFPSAPAAVRPPAAWSATPWRSPTSIRSQYGLLFERFLNPERISMPDIDIDFCTRRRGEVIQYVTEKYGREQVAQIITFGTLGARAAIKDVGRVLDMTFADVDRITKLIPNAAQHQAEADACRQEPRLRRARPQGPARQRSPRRRRSAWKAWRATPACTPPASSSRREPLQRTRPALQDEQGRNCHPVRHERPGEAVAFSRWTSSA